MNLTGWSKSLEVTADGAGIVSHAGLAVLRLLADKTGLTGGLSHAPASIEARHGALPGVRIADKVLQGVTCIRLDATVTPACSDKELAEPKFKGFGHHPSLGYCDNTGEPLAGMMRRGSAGSDTTADHLQVLGDAITAARAAPE